MNLEQPVCGLILAGGQGRRVSNRDKGLLDWRGKPLAQHVADRLRPQVDELFISCNRNPSAYARLGADLVHDDRSGFQGPLAGLESMRERCRTCYLVVVPCDTPLLPEDLVSRLLQALTREGKPGYQVSYASDGDRKHYLCAAMRPGTLDSISHQLDRGRRAVRDWYATLKTVPVDFSDRPGAFENINRMD